MKMDTFSKGGSVIIGYIVWVFIIANMFLAITIVFLERRQIAATWAWLLILSLLPVVGFFVYIMFGQNLSRYKIFRLPSNFTDEYLQMIEDQKEQLRQNKIAFHDVSSLTHQEIIRLNLYNGRSIFSQNNKVDILIDGQDKYAALKRDIEQAKHHIHILYYIIRNDHSGRGFRDLLVRKAKEGVHVRVLYDDMGSSRLPKNFFQALHDAGGQSAAFFPSKWLPYLNFRVNYRNHRKLVIIDGQIGYIGGFNIGDEYLGLDQRFGYWRDTHLRLMGSAVDSMQFRFMLDWNNASTAKLQVEPMYFPDKQNEGTAGVQIVSSGPDSDQEQIKDGIIKLIYTAKESIVIQTPYFVPDESMMQAIKVAALSGVEIDIMIPVKPDHMFVYWASWSYLGRLLPYGVRVHTYNHGFIHAKTITVDQQLASVGTVNFDMRSFKLNFEVNAFIFDTATSRKLHDVFVADLELSQQRTLEEYKNRPWTIRIKESISRLLSPIL